MKRIIFLCIFCCLQFTEPGISQKTGSASVVFVLDCSGSMWQKISNETKISIAKRVLTELATKLPSNTKTGLIAYGHNSKSDCKDIETLLKLDAIHKDEFIAKLNKLDPKGKTPIAKSLEHALNEIQNESTNSNIVLISDGLETCEGNACDLIANARKQGKKITVHVIGFGIEESNLAALECIAQAGGGQYFPVNKPDELLPALEKSIEAPILTGGFLSIEATHNNQLEDVVIRVFKSGDLKEYVSARTYSERSTNPRIMPLPPGTYRVGIKAVRLDGQPEQFLENVSIKNDTIAHILDFSTGNLEIQVTNNGHLSDASLQILKPGTKTAIASGRTYTNQNSNPRKFQILPGNYDIEISSVDISGRPQKIFANQQIISGKTLKLHQNFETGQLVIGARQGDQLIDATINITKQGTSVGSGRTYTSSNSNPKTFILEAGSYKIELRPVKPKGLLAKSIEIKLKANEILEKMISW